ncbi:MAG: ABC transporter ATP-binding protein [Candidatus Heimdallarchaeota archaeon]|nr:ABC transporter ATP-binding protein [Candidatus Heimdallarchaeota archaeon]
MALVLEAQNLKKMYGNTIEAVKGLNLTIEQSTVFGFLGPNGAGKSTSINMFAGLLAPTSGSLSVLGYSLPEEVDLLKEKIGYVPQDLIFFNHLTVFENMELFAVNYGIANRDQRINFLLEKLQIIDLKDRRASNMSGGQKRRLNLALGMINNPKLLILDEPSAGMDAHSRNILWDIIRSIAAEGMTIILTTHLIETADRLSDTIAIIDQGIVKVADTPSNLKKEFGDGEILEITWKEIPTDEQLSSLEKDINDITELNSCSLMRFTSKFQTDDAVNNLTDILDVVDKLIGRTQIANISIHESTLEDVFIKITGKGLKEEI